MSSIGYKLKRNSQYNKAKDTFNYKWRAIAVREELSAFPIVEFGRTFH